MEKKEYTIFDKLENKPVIDPEDGKPVVIVIDNPNDSWIDWADAKVFEMNDYKSKGRFILKQRVI